MRSLWGHCLCSICIVLPLCHIALYCLSAFVSTGFQVYCPKVTFESFVNVKAGYFLLISKSKEQPEIKWLHYRGGRLYLKISFLNCENTKSFRQQKHIMKNGPEYQANWSDNPIRRKWSRKKTVFARTLPWLTWKPVCSLLDKLICPSSHGELW